VRYKYLQDEKEKAKSKKSKRNITRLNGEIKKLGLTKDEIKNINRPKSAPTKKMNTPPDVRKKNLLEIKEFIQQSGFTPETKQNYLKVINEKIKNLQNTTGFYEEPQTLRSSAPSGYQPVEITAGRSANVAGRRSSQPRASTEYHSPPQRSNTSSGYNSPSSRNKLSSGTYMEVEKITSSESPGYVELGPNTQPVIYSEPNIRPPSQSNAPPGYRNPRTLRRNQNGKGTYFTPSNYDEVPQQSKSNPDYVELRSVNSNYADPTMLERGVHNTYFTPSSIRKSTAKSGIYSDPNTTGDHDTYMRVAPAQSEKSSSNYEEVL
jgi:hypothetical protein